MVSQRGRARSPPTNELSHSASQSFLLFYKGFSTGLSHRPTSVAGRLSRVTSLQSPAPIATGVTATMDRTCQEVCFNETSPRSCKVYENRGIIVASVEQNCSNYLVVTRMMAMEWTIKDIARHIAAEPESALQIDEVDNKADCFLRAQVLNPSTQDVADFLDKRPDGVAFRRPVGAQKQLRILQITRAAMPAMTGKIRKTRRRISDTADKSSSSPNSGSSLISLLLQIDVIF